MPEVKLPFPRAFVEFDDPGDSNTVYRCDLTWLTSRWTCIFGSGCRGIYADRPDDGCCTLGAHFADADDEKRVRKAVRQLTGEQWQHKKVARKGGWVELEGPETVAEGDEPARKTRVVDGACIFLNRPDFARGPGCALHIAALDAGERPLDWKPDVCWQLPLRLQEHTDDHGHVTSTLREWKRRDWGAGGEEFHWWCTEGDEAFVARDPVYRTMRDEIVEMVGEAVYERMVALLERPRWTPLPHPAVRR